MSTIDTRARYLGAMLGLAAGDAVGTALEFTIPGSFKPITQMIGGGPFELEPGEWTDDTSMALCLAESLLLCDGFDPQDQMERYERWYRDGYMSSNGLCFDIGGTVLSALTAFALNGTPFAGSTHERSAGNGSLMRLAPVPLFYAASPATAMAMAGESSRTTHGAPQAVDACIYYAGLMIGALQGVDKETLLRPLYAPIPDYWETRPMHAAVREVLRPDLAELEPPEIRGDGYVVRSLQAALWAFARCDSFREGCLLAANLGEDADTTAAIYGQLAGAWYGVDNIPADWRQKLAKRELIIDLAQRLYAAADPPATQPSTC